jgi:hypothetical protein
LAVPPVLPWSIYPVFAKRSPPPISQWGVYSKPD